MKPAAGGGNLGDAYECGTSEVVSDLPPNVFGDFISKSSIMASSRPFSRTFTVPTTFPSWSITKVVGKRWIP
jgi:hypothetical protein